MADQMAIKRVTRVDQTVVCMAEMKVVMRVDSRVWMTDLLMVWMC